jgi:surface antigen
MGFGILLMVIPLQLNSGKQTQTTIRDTYVVAVRTMPEPLPIEVKSKSGYQIIEKASSKYGYNCVSYVSSKVQTPRGLGSLAQKKSHIKTTVPAEGSVAVLNEGPVGHVAIVEEIRGDQLIISETNFIHGFYTKRAISINRPLGFF